MEKQEVLKRLGLSNDETNVYLELLYSGSVKAYELSKTIKLPRTTVYNILNSLSSKGLASHTIVSGVKSFQAADPNKLLASLKENEKCLQEILPELEKIKERKKEKPSVEIYDGKEGIKSIMEDLIKTRKPLCAFSSTKHILDLLQYYAPQFIKKRIGAGIKIKLLTEKTKITEELMKGRDRAELRETRFIPKIEGFPNTLYIYGNKLAILDTNPENPLGVLIQNENIANTQRVLFEIMWEKAEK